MSIKTPGQPPAIAPQISAVVPDAVVDSPKRIEQPTAEPARPDDSFSLDAREPAPIEQPMALPEAGGAKATEMPKSLAAAEERLVALGAEIATLEARATAGESGVAPLLGERRREAALFARHVEALSFGMQSSTRMTPAELREALEGLKSADPPLHAALVPFDRAKLVMLVSPKIDLATTMGSRVSDDELVRFAVKREVGPELARVFSASAEARDPASAAVLALATRAALRGLEREKAGLAIDEKRATANPAERGRLPALAERQRIVDAKIAAAEQLLGGAPSASVEAKPKVAEVLSLLAKPGADLAHGLFSRLGVAYNDNHGKRPIYERLGFDRAGFAAAIEAFAKSGTPSDEIAAIFEQAKKPPDNINDLVAVAKWSDAHALARFVCELKKLRLEGAPPAERAQAADEATALAKIADAFHKRYSAGVEEQAKSARRRATSLRAQAEQAPSEAARARALAEADTLAARSAAQADALDADFAAAAKNADHGGQPKTADRYRTHAGRFSVELGELELADTAGRSHETRGAAAEKYRARASEALSAVHEPTAPASLVASGGVERLIAGVADAQLASTGFGSPPLTKEQRERADAIKNEPDPLKRAELSRALSSEIAGERLRRLGRLSSDEQAAITALLTKRGRANIAAYDAFSAATSQLEQAPPKQLSEADRATLAEAVLARNKQGLVAMSDALVSKGIADKQAEEKKALDAAKRALPSPERAKRELDEAKARAHTAHNRWFSWIYKSDSTTRAQALADKEVEIATLRHTMAIMGDRVTQEALDGFEKRVAEIEVDKARIQVQAARVGTSHKTDDLDAQTTAAGHGYSRSAYDAVLDAEKTLLAKKRALAASSDKLTAAASLEQRGAAAESAVHPALVAVDPAKRSAADWIARVETDSRDAVRLAKDPALASTARLELALSGSESANAVAGARTTLARQANEKAARLGAAARAADDELRGLASNRRTLEASLAVDQRLIDGLASVFHGPVAHGAGRATANAAVRWAFDTAVAERHLDDTRSDERRVSAGGSEDLHHAAELKSEGRALQQGAANAARLGKEGLDVAAEIARGLPRDHGHDASRAAVSEAAGRQAVVSGQVGHTDDARSALGIGRDAVKAISDTEVRATAGQRLRANAWRAEAAAHEARKDGVAACGPDGRLQPGTPAVSAGAVPAIARLAKDLEHEAGVDAAKVTEPGAALLAAMESANEAARDVSDRPALAEALFARWTAALKEGHLEAAAELEVQRARTQKQLRDSMSWLSTGAMKLVEAEVALFSWDSGADLVVGWHDEESAQAAKDISDAHATALTAVGAGLKEMRRLRAEQGDAAAVDFVAGFLARVSVEAREPALAAAYGKELDRTPLGTSAKPGVPPVTTQLAKLARDARDAGDRLSGSYVDMIEKQRVAAKLGATEDATRIFEGKQQFLAENQEAIALVQEGVQVVVTTLVTLGVPVSAGGTVVSAERWGQALFALARSGPIGARLVVATERGLALTAAGERVMQALNITTAAGHMIVVNGAQGWVGEMIGDALGDGPAGKLAQGLMGLVNVGEMQHIFRVDKAATFFGRAVSALKPAMLDFFVRQAIQHKSERNPEGAHFTEELWSLGAFPFFNALHGASQKRAEQMEASREIAKRLLPNEVAAVHASLAELLVGAQALGGPETSPEEHAIGLATLAARVKAQNSRAADAGEPVVSQRVLDAVVAELHLEWATQRELSSHRGPLGAREALALEARLREQAPREFPISADAWERALAPLWVRGLEGLDTARPLNADEQTLLARIVDLLPEEERAKLSAAELDVSLGVLLRQCGADARAIEVVLEAANAQRFVADVAGLSAAGAAVLNELARTHPTTFFAHLEGPETLGLSPEDRAIVKANNDLEQAQRTLAAVRHAATTPGAAAEKKRAELDALAAFRASVEALPLTPEKKQRALEDEHRRSTMSRIGLAEAERGGPLAIGERLEIARTLGTEVGFESRATEETLIRAHCAVELGKNPRAASSELLAAIPAERRNNGDVDVVRKLLVELHGSRAAMSAIEAAGAAHDAAESERVETFRRTIAALDPGNDAHHAAATDAFIASLVTGRPPEPVWPHPTRESGDLAAYRTKRGAALDEVTLYAAFENRGMAPQDALYSDVRYPRVRPGDDLLVDLDLLPADARPFANIVSFDAFPMAGFNKHGGASGANDVLRGFYGPVFEIWTREVESAGGNVRFYRGGAGKLEAMVVFPPEIPAAKRQRALDRAAEASQAAGDAFIATGLAGETPLTKVKNPEDPTYHNGAKFAVSVTAIKSDESAKDQRDAARAATKARLPKLPEEPSAGKKRGVDKQSAMPQVPFPGAARSNGDVGQVSGGPILTIDVRRNRHLELYSRAKPPISEAEARADFDDAVRMDPTTGLHRFEELAGTMLNAAAWAAQNKGRVFYAEFDVANLSGITRRAIELAHGDKQVGFELADGIFRQPVKENLSEVAAVVQKHNGELHVFRKGGDEFGFVFVFPDGTPPEAFIETRLALLRAQGKVLAWVESATITSPDGETTIPLRNIEHAKHPGNAAKAGTGSTTSLVEVDLAGVSPADAATLSAANAKAMAAADVRVEVKKGHKTIFASREAVATRAGVAPGFVGSAGRRLVELELANATAPSMMPSEITAARARLRQQKIDALVDEFHCTRAQAEAAVDAGKHAPATRIEKVGAKGEVRERGMPADESEIGTEAELPTISPEVGTELDITQPVPPAPAELLARADALGADNPLGNLTRRLAEASARAPEIGVLTARVLDGGGSAAEQQARLTALELLCTTLERGALGKERTLLAAEALADRPLSVQAEEALARLQSLSTLNPQTARTHAELIAGALALSAIAKREGVDPFATPASTLVDAETRAALTKAPTHVALLTIDGVETPCVVVSGPSEGKLAVALPNGENRVVGTSDPALVRVDEVSMLATPEPVVAFERRVYGDDQEERKSRHYLCGHAAGRAIVFDTAGVPARFVVAAPGDYRSSVHGFDALSVDTQAHYSRFERFRKEPDVYLRASPAERARLATELDAWAKSKGLPGATPDENPLLWKRFLQQRVDATLAKARSAEEQLLIVMQLGLGNFAEAEACLDFVRVYFGPSPKDATTPYPPPGALLALMTAAGFEQGHASSCAPTSVLAMLFRVSPLEALSVVAFGPEHARRREREVAGGAKLGEARPTAAVPGLPTVRTTVSTAGESGWDEGMTRDEKLAALNREVGERIGARYAYRDRAADTLLRDDVWSALTTPGAERASEGVSLSFDVVEVLPNGKTRASRHAMVAMSPSEERNESGLSVRKCTLFDGNGKSYTVAVEDLFGGYFTLPGSRSELKLTGAILREPPGIARMRGTPGMATDRFDEMVLGVRMLDAVSPRVAEQRYKRFAAALSTVAPLFGDGASSGKLVASLASIRDGALLDAVSGQLAKTKSLAEIDVLIADVERFQRTTAKTLAADASFSSLSVEARELYVAGLFNLRARAEASAALLSIATNPAVARLNETDQVALALRVCADTPLRNDAVAKTHEQLRGESPTDALSKALAEHTIGPYVLGMGRETPVMEVHIGAVAPCGVQQFQDQGSRPARRAVVDIGEHKLTVTLPDPAPADQKIASLEDIADAARHIPVAHLRELHTVRVNDRENTGDPGWRTKYKDPNFRSAATAGEHNVDFYPWSAAPTRQAVRDTMRHEVGHLVEAAVFGDKGWEAWESAVEGDRMRASQYARETRREDFAEAYSLYLQVRGTPEEAALRALMPNRFALLDAICDSPQLVRANVGPGLGCRNAEEYRTACRVRRFFADDEGAVAWVVGMRNANQALREAEAARPPNPQHIAMAKKSVETVREILNLTTRAVGDDSPDAMERELEHRSRLATLSANARPSFLAELGRRKVDAQVLPMLEVVAEMLSGPAPKDVDSRIAQVLDVLPSVKPVDRGPVASLLGCGSKEAVAHALSLLRSKTPDALREISERAKIAHAVCSLARTSDRISERIDFVLRFAPMEREVAAIALRDALPARFEDAREIVRLASTLAKDELLGEGARARMLTLANGDPSALERVVTALGRAPRNEAFLNFATFGVESVDALARTFEWGAGLVASAPKSGASRTAMDERGLLPALLELVATGDLTEARADALLQAVISNPDHQVMKDLSGVDAATRNDVILAHAQRTETAVQVPANDPADVEAQGPRTRPFGVPSPSPAADEAPETSRVPVLPAPKEKPVQVEVVAATGAREPPRNPHGHTDHGRAALIERAKKAFVDHASQRKFLDAVVEADARYQDAQTKHDERAIAVARRDLDALNLCLLQAKFAADRFKKYQQGGAAREALGKSATASGLRSDFDRVEALLRTSPAALDVGVDVMAETQRVPEPRAVTLRTPPAPSKRGPGSGH